MLIESLKPLTVRLRSGTVRMEPGTPVEFSDEDGRKLLERVPGKVRVVSPDPIVIDPAAGNPRPVYWERAGSIIGPGSLVCHAPLIVAPSRDDAPQQAAENVVIEPASANPRPVYWERAGSIIGPGSLITWCRADGSQPEGFVDFIHRDDTGTRWACVSLPGHSWGVVNVKFLKEVKS